MPTMLDYALASTVVRFNRNNRMLYAYQSRPRDMGQYPGVLVLHDVEGLSDADRHATRVLAAADYVGKAFDIYSRAETPKPDKLVNVEDRAAFFAKIPDERVMDDMDRAVEVLRKLHWTHGHPLGVLGFGMGAYYALLLVGRCPEITACALVAPRFSFEQQVPKKGATDLKPVKLDRALINAQSNGVVILAGQDPECTAPQAEALLDLCDRQSFATRQVRLEAAGRRFWDPKAEGHDPAATEAMWTEVLGYFAQRLR